MPDEEVSLQTVYDEVDKRIKAAIDALRADLLKYLADNGFKEKVKFKIFNRPAAS